MTTDQILTHLHGERARHAAGVEACDRAIEALQAALAVALPALATTATEPANPTKTTKPTPPTAPASTDDVLGDRGDRVVAALKEASPQRPGELQRAAKLTRLTPYVWKSLLAELATAGRIVREGQGRGAIVRLPGKNRAKEGL